MTSSDAEPSKGSAPPATGSDGKAVYAQRASSDAEPSKGSAPPATGSDGKAVYAQRARAPLLVLGVGNPSRGDDALGSLFVDRAEETLRTEVEGGQVEFLTDFQLQVEHALDLVGRRRVVFVDASVRAEAPYQYARVEANRDASFSSHAMSPAAVLDAHRTVVGEPPPAWTLAIRGDRFELGDDLTPAAAANLEAALVFFVGEARSFLRHGQERAWRSDREGAGS